MAAQFSSLKPAPPVYATTLKADPAVEPVKDAAAGLGTDMQPATARRPTIRSAAAGSRQSNQKGVYLIEVAIILPLLIGFIFAAIDVARLTEGYSAVRMASALGSRWAAGVSRPRWKVFRDLWALQDASGLIPLDALNGTNEPYYRFSYANTNFYQDDQFLPAADRFTSLYEMELRAIAYANNVVKESLGEVKYPCRGEAACLACFTIRRDADHTPSEDDFSQGYNEAGHLLSFPVKMLGVRCDYNVPISSSSIVLGWFPPFITVSSIAFVPINDYANIYYDREY